MFLLKNKHDPRVRKPSLSWEDWGWTATISQIILSFFFPVREDESMSVDDNKFISNLK
jgi:hypothetical protein